MKIKNLRDLFALVAGREPDSHENMRKRIGHALYKATDCGISFRYSPGHKYVVLAGYAEGTDAECAPITMRFPFTADKFWDAVEQADRDGCELFDETHCPDCGGEGYSVEEGCDCGTLEVAGRDGDQGRAD